MYNILMVKFAISLYIFILIIVIIAIVLRNKIKSEEIKKYNETLEEKRQEGFYKIVPVTVRDLETKTVKEEKPKVHRSKYRYYKKKIMTDREIIFFKKLNRVIPRGFIVIPQAHLSSFFGVQSGQAFKYAFLHINQKSVDFVICDIDDFMPVIALELDDRTHMNKNRRERDIEVNAIFRDSHLPLIRVWSINVSDEKLRQALYSRLYR